jgi:two-component system heavy metal sensor histidine kinase CusS
MNSKSTRFRITAWYSISLSLATIVLFVSFFIVTKQTLYSRVDSELLTHGNAIVNLTAKQRSPLHKVLLSHIASDEFNQMPGMLVVLLNPQGKTMQSSLSQDNFQDSYTPLFTHASQTANPIFQDAKVGKTQMRFYAKSISNNGQHIGVILVAHPIDVIQKSLNSLLFILGIVFVVLIIPMILGGYMMARSIMQPISDMITKLQEIGSEHLQKRINNPKTGDEMEELAFTFNNLLERLQNMFQRERQFIGDVAHELKTPLATLQSGIEITLAKKRSKEEYKKALEEALIDAQRQSKMLSNILDLAWSEASNGQDETKRINLSELIYELEDIMQRLAQQKNIIIEKNIAKKIYINAVGTKDKLARAILNILDNAIKYTPHQGKITVTLKRDQKFAVINVNDTGRGIAEKDMPHIFERFYRGSLTDKTQGSGLGLAIAQSIIHVHHGTIQVKSTAGKGTIVTISLPIIQTT